MDTKTFKIAVPLRGTLAQQLSDFCERHGGLSKAAAIRLILADVLPARLVSARGVCQEATGGT